MDEARVELLVGARVPERIEPVAMVNVCIAAHHLAVDALDVGLEGFGEARGLAKPFAAFPRGGICEADGSGVCGEDGGVGDFA